MSRHNVVAVLVNLANDIGKWPGIKREERFSFIVADDISPATVKFSAGFLPDRLEKPEREFIVAQYSSIHCVDITATWKFSTEGELIVSLVRDNGYPPLISSTAAVHDRQAVNDFHVIEAWIQHNMHFLMLSIGLEVITHNFKIHHQRVWNYVVCPQWFSIECPWITRQHLKVTVIQEQVA